MIGDELNVKALRLTMDREELLQYEVKPVPRILGMKHGQLYLKVMEALRGLGPEEAKKVLAGETVEVEAGDKLIAVLPEEVEVVLVPLPGYSVVEEGGLMVGVRTEMTKGLEYEGLARDVVRRIQALRKEAGFEIDDHIETYYSGDEEVEAVFDVEGEYIAIETLSDGLHRDQPPQGAHVGEFDIDGLKLTLGLKRNSR